MTIKVGRRRRVSAALAVAAISAAALTGCTPTDNIAIRLVDGDVVFAICETVAAGQIEVLSIDKTVKPYVASQDWLSESVSSVELEIIDYGRPPPGFDDIVSPKPLTLKGHFIQLYVNAIDSSGDALTGIFAQFDGDAISSDVWLASDGAKRQTECG